MCNSDDDTKYAGFKYLDRYKSDVGKMNGDTDKTSAVGVKKRHGQKIHGGKSSMSYLINYSFTNVLIRININSYIWDSNPFECSFWYRKF